MFIRNVKKILGNDFIKIDRIYVQDILMWFSVVRVNNIFCLCVFKVGEKQLFIWEDLIRKNIF